MNRGGRGNRRRYDDSRHSISRSARPSWLDAFDRDVDRTRAFAISQHGRERGIPVISFSFIGEQQIREAHGRLTSGRSNELRDRVTPATRPADDASASTERAAKRQKKGKETEKPGSSSTAQNGNEKDESKKQGGAKPKVDKETELKRFDAELDDYFDRQAGDANTVAKEQTAPPVEQSHEGNNEEQ